MTRKKGIIVIIAIFSFFLILFIIRLINPIELDDISPEIPCEQELIDKAEVIWIIPKFNNISIAENKSWCENILNLNKSIGMHGVAHEYYEFKTDRSQEYLDEGINIFKECFGFMPTMFKSPQLKISRNNAGLIKNNNLELRGVTNQMTRKVYHCNDSDIFKNWFIDLF
jgi:predicted deacetylase